MADPTILRISCSILVWTVFIGQTIAGDKPILSTNEGRIQGKWLGEVAVFLGIPYARPPVELLRFKKPIPNVSWKPAVLIAENYSAACQSISLKHQNYGMSEDCLYLNIFTPMPRDGVPLPVLVWLHGGGYASGSAADFPEKSVAELSERGIVVVTLNYRLNFYGFFTTQTDAFPANLGLWDQIQALRWVKNSIAPFGGDPDRVTLGGHGTGATMASLLTYSPLLEGLFHQIILQSGTALTPFALSGNRYRIESSKILAQKLGCITEEEWNNGNFTADFEQCLKSSSWENIRDSWMVGFSSGPAHDPFFQSVWAPVVDEAGGILPRHPVDLRFQRPKSENFRALIGSTNAESSQLVISKLKHDNRSLTNFTETDLDRMLAVLARPEAFPGKFRAVRDLVKFVYSQQFPIGRNDHPAWVNAIVQSASDYWMNAGVAAEASRLSQIGAQVFLYSFDYVSPSPSTAKSYRTARHGLDQLFLFPGLEPFQTELGLEPWQFSSEDMQISQFLGTMVADFVKSDDNFAPAGIAGWQSVNFNESNQPFLRILTRPHLSTSFHSNGANLWNIVMPTILNLPYCDTDAHDIAGSRGGTPSSFTDNNSTESLVYFAMTWILLGLLLSLCVVFAIVVYHYRQRLKSFDLLRRIEELSFI